MIEKYLLVITRLLDLRYLQKAHNFLLYHALVALGCYLPPALLTANGHHSKPPMGNGVVWFGANSPNINWANSLLVRGDGSSLRPRGVRGRTEGSSWREKEFEALGLSVSFL